MIHKGPSICLPLGRKQLPRSIKDSLRNFNVFSNYELSKSFLIVILNMCISCFAYGMLSTFELFRSLVSFFFFCLVAFCSWHLFILLIGNPESLSLMVHFICRNFIIISIFFFSCFERVNCFYHDKLFSNNKFSFLFPIQA